ncbi:hypothetical protein [Xylophilus sp. ASV27]|uniref:hypothetical protein n=1 Tax=Xylophilus sp. ASV27 TaxID=2795129 RepID=UPI0018ED7FF5|nr:hypothetical protein [Xylophilus sp. ASV27]
MNASKLFAIAALSAVASVGAHAASTSMGEGDNLSPYALQIQPQVAPPGYRLLERATGPVTPIAATGEGDQRSQYALQMEESTTSRATVAAEARQAQRQGMVARGEAGYSAM